jgi:ABC-type Fe3+/spermidine/putrescine transport system ATPase subunit
MNSNTDPSFLIVDSIDKQFKETKAVDQVSFALAKGDFLTLLGPSGCGKTTTLRAIAGFETIDTGSISIDGQVVSDPVSGIDLPAEKRSFGMVFQSYAVWPHMTVAENAAYGLHNAGMSKDDQRKAVERVLKMVGLSGEIDRPATMLSGGQQQRVALARAIVYEPKILLFDEPLSNLDAKLRERMRLELRRLQAELGITSVYVTHDQEEAMVVSDIVIVMNLGRIQQIGSPQDIYDRPANRFVADFIGAANIFDCKVSEIDNAAGLAKVEALIGNKYVPLLASCYQDLKLNATASLCIRHENLRLLSTSEAPTSGWNTLTGVVNHRINMGSYVDYVIMINDTEVNLRAPRAIKIEVGEEALVSFPRDQCLCLPN